MIWSPEFKSLAFLVIFCKSQITNIIIKSSEWKSPQSMCEPVGRRESKQHKKLRKEFTEMWARLQKKTTRDKESQHTENKKNSFFSPSDIIVCL